MIFYRAEIALTTEIPNTEKKERHCGNVQSDSFSFYHTYDHL